MFVILGIEQIPKTTNLRIQIKNTRSQAPIIEFIVRIKKKNMQIFRTQFESLTITKPVALHKHSQPLF